jgi:hypothetical protein
MTIPLLAQQKGQYVPGQFGLNAGAIPDPGFTYANITVNYSASQLNNASGNAIPGITGTYGFWLTENILYFVPNAKVLGGHFAPLIMLPLANGSLVGDGPRGLPPFGINTVGEGYADTWVQPVNFGWHWSRASFSAGYAFVAPTGRFTPGATNNVGSGYWGNHFVTGSTVYLTKNKGTSASLFTHWEFHERKRGTNETPGQAFTMEWGIGQILPLDKQLHKLFQFGVIGYDQWQVSSNSGTIPVGPIVVQASRLPFYSVHAIGLQTNFILPAKGLSLFFKYEPEYLAKSRPQGRTLAFGGSWTLRIPKPQAAVP